MCAPNVFSITEWFLIVSGIMNKKLQLAMLVIIYSVWLSAKHTEDF
jgi:hypothetical protein